MPFFPLDGGCNDVADPTAIGLNQFQSGRGCEYRPNDTALWIARGRDRKSDALTLFGTNSLKFISFDDGSLWVIVQIDNSNMAIWQASSSGTLNLITSSTSGISSISPAPLPINWYIPWSFGHISNAYYGAAGSDLKRIERSGANLTVRAVGYAPPSLAPNALTSGSGTFTSSFGMTYWHTWYDSTRGWESTASPRINTGAFSNAASVGVAYNSAPPAGVDKWRIYRSSDGGAFPDGGLIAELPITTSTYADTNTVVTALVVPFYSYVQAGDFPFDTDAQPPTLNWVSQYKGSLIGATQADQRSIRFSFSGRPNSWPACSEIFINPPIHDISVAGQEVGQLFLIFFTGHIYRINGLSADGDVDYELLTDERGTYNQNLVTLFHNGSRNLCAFVAKDGIWATDGVNLLEITPAFNWDKVDLTQLYRASLVNDASNRRLIFSYFKPDGSMGLAYFYYEGGIRWTPYDVGSVFGMTSAVFNGDKVILSLASDQTDSGAVKIFQESSGVLDESGAFDSSTLAVPFNVQTGQVFPAGIGEVGHIDYIYAHHSEQDFSNSLSSKSPDITFHYDPQETDDIGEPLKTLRDSRDWSTRGEDEIEIGQDAASCWIEINSTDPVQFRLDWLQFDPDIVDRKVRNAGP